MARNQIVSVTLMCILSVKIVEGKVFSSTLDEITIFQQPHIATSIGEAFSRKKRSESNTTNESDYANVIHSQNLTLSSTTFALHGVADNQAFVYWTGPNNDTVFVLTRSHKRGGIQSNTLWRSTNYGETYSKVILPTDFAVNHMYSSKASRSNTILSDLRARKLYTTQDTGQTWKLVELQFSSFRMLLHPTMEKLVLAYSLLEMKLYLSEDFGTTWTLIKERVTERFFWAVPGVDADLRTIHMELQDAMGPVSYHACIAPKCEEMDIDKSVGTIDFYSLVVENEYIFVQKSVDDNTTLYISYKRGPFKKAFFPQKSQALDFNIIDTSENQVFIVVDHEGDIANLYLSDITGQFFVTSMENVVGLRYPGKFDVDLIKVKGIKGVYIVNKFDAHRNNGGVFKQKTYITFNKGGSWTSLPSPEVDKQYCIDQNKCNLHLHLSNTNMFFHIPLVVTMEEAPGLILAHGSVGQYLDMSTHVYISRDAGLTWTPAPFFGNHFLNIMDQGSAISAISAEGQPTNQVHFSCTEGETWDSHNITEQLMNVDGVVNEPGIRTLISSVFGHMNTSKGWVMVKINFSSVLKNKCQHDDFELWSPASDLMKNENRCIMGETLVYERRKQMSQCYYGSDYFRPKSVVPCGCSRGDYECDFGYEVAEENSCIMAAWFEEESLPAPHCVDGKYNKTSGYRKVASNNCHGGKETRYQSVETNCPLIAPKGLHIVTEKSCVPRGVKVVFRLTQESGSEEETTYTWSFGNDTSPVTKQGLQNAAIMTTTFSSLGTYNVTVTAVNSKGNATAVLAIHIEDELKGVLVEIPWGARIGTPSYFNVTVLGSDNLTQYGKENSLHFAWQFENKLTGSLRQLTWQNVIQQQFTEPGEYRLTLEVFNSVSSVFYTQAVEVYDDVTTVRLHFSKEINNYNSSSLNVRQALAEILCHNLAQILEIRRTRIIMSVQPYNPVVGDVTILPARPDMNESEIYQVAEMLIEQAKQQNLAFPLFTSDDIVIITDAGILDLKTGEESPTVSPLPQSVTVTVQVPVNVTMVQEKHNLLAVYISVPVILGVVIVAIIITMYYRKKFAAGKRYSLIVKQRHRARMSSRRRHNESTCSDVPLNLEEEPEFTIIPDIYYGEDEEPTLTILNEPRDGYDEHDIEEC